MDEKYVKRPMIFGRFFVLMEIIPYICPKVFVWQANLLL